MSKSIFKSKTLWLNVLLGAAAIGEVLPPKYSVPVITVANIAARFITTGQVSIFGGR